MRSLLTEQLESRRVLTHDQFYSFEGVSDGFAVTNGQGSHAFVGSDNVLNVGAHTGGQFMRLRSQAPGTYQMERTFDTVRGDRFSIWGVFDRNGGVGAADVIIARADKGDQRTLWYSDTRDTPWSMDTDPNISQEGEQVVAWDGPTVVIIRLRQNASSAGDMRFGVDSLLLNRNHAPSAPGNSWGGSGFVAENASYDSEVGIRASSSDSDGDPLNYRLVDDAGGRFKIDSATGIVRLANPSLINYESGQSHVIGVAANDGYADSTPTYFAISVGNIKPSTPSDSNPASNFVWEDVTSGGVGITATSSDPNGATLRYRLTNDAGGRFAIDLWTGVVRVANADPINYESGSSHLITVVANDGYADSDPQDFTISVGNLRPSTVSDSNGATNFVLESAISGSAVGLIAAATDPKGAPIRYRLTDDAGGRFAIGELSGIVTVANSSLINYESMQRHYISIVANDGFSDSDPTVFEIAVGNVKPTSPADSDLASNFVWEDVANGAPVGVRAASTDPKGAPLRYRLTNNAGGRFAIDPVTGTITVANASLINFETLRTHDVTVVVSDGFTDSNPTTFTISVANVSPSNLSDADASENVVREDVVNGAPVGLTVAAIDPNGAPLRYTLTNNAGGRFTIDSETGEVTVADASLINFENVQSHSITVVASDGTATSSPVSFPITVRNVEPSIPVDNDPLANEVYEGASNGTYTGLTARSADPNGPAVTYRLLSDARGRFAINAASGAVTVANGSLLNYRSASSHSVVVEASDPAGLAAVQTFTIAVQPVNTPPRLQPVTDQRVDEQDVLEFTATASDDDVPAQRLRYSLDDASVSRGMSIDELTGAFRWTPSEMQGGAIYTVAITVTDDGLPNNLHDSKTITITVDEVNVAPELAAIDDQQVDEQAELNFTVSATDQDLPAQALKYTLDAASIAGGMSIDEVSGLFRWTPSESQGGQAYPVTIAVTDDGADPSQLSDSQTITITVAEVNAAPELATIDDRHVDEQAELSFAISATDQDAPAQRLTYRLDAASIALGMSIEPATGLFRWTPTESQGGSTYPVTITVTDDGANPSQLSDSQTITITVAEVNVAPELAAIDDQQVDEQAELSFSVAATDQDVPAQALKYTLDAASIARGMSIDDVSGLFRWTPSESQGGEAYPVTITVADSGANPNELSQSQAITITVVEVNVTPELAAIDDQQVDEQAELSFTVSATDQDEPAQALQYSLDEASVARGMSIDRETGEFRWTPSEAQGGATYPVTITVMDEGINPVELSHSRTFSITVAEVNVAPEAAVIDDQQVNEQTELSFAVSASDQDLPSQSLRFSLDNASVALGMSIDAETGLFRWTPSEVQGGVSYVVTLTVTDDGSNPDQLIDIQTFTITVDEVNDAPELATIDNGRVDEQAELSFTVSATDQDAPAQTIRYSLDDASVAQGMTIDAETGLFTWAPSETQGGGVYLVTILATDDGSNPDGLTDSQTFTIAVDEVNVAPELLAVGDQRGDEQTELAFAVSAADQDLPAQTLRYSLDDASIARGMSIDPLTGHFRWTPSETQGGASYPVTITVTDDGSNPDAGADSETFTITVDEVNAVPELALLDNKQVNEQVNLTFTVSAADQDMPVQTLRYRLDDASIALGMSIDSGSGVFSWTPSETQGGAVYSVTVTVTDDGRNPDQLEDSQTVSIAVPEANLAPELAPVENQRIDEQASLSFAVSASDQDIPAQTLRYRLDDASLARGMSIDALTGVFRWTPSEAQGGAVYTVVLTVADDGSNPDSLEDQQSFEITVDEVNVAPVLTQINDQTVDEQSPISFTASAFDQDAPVQTLSYSLDLASLSLDMSIDPLTGVFKWTPSETQGGGLYSVTLTVTDNGENPPELYDSQTFVIKVDEANAAPELAPIADMTVNEQVTLTFTASATDQDVPVQTLSYSLDADSLARGMSIDPLTGIFTWTPTESQGGTVYPVTVRVSDDGANPARLEHSQTFAIAVVDMAGSVVIVDDNELRGERILQVFGTTGDDTIHIKRTNDPNTIRVELNDVPYSVVIGGGLTPPVTRIVVYGDSGNDNIHVWKQLDMPTELHGGAGDDQLRGGAASDILLGEEGNDALFGYDGRDLLIGGSGADDIRGGDDDDILVGGWTSLDSSIVALDAVLKEWRSSRSFGERTDNLRGAGTGPRLNQDYFLIDAGATETVRDDGAVDSLRGDSGHDWFFADLPQDISVESLILDTIKNLSAAERRRLSTVFAQALKAIWRA